MVVSILQKRKSDLSKSSIILYVCFALAVFSFASNCLAEQLYGYKSGRGTLTFSTKKPVGQSYYIVSPKTPQKSVFVYHRGLGYNFSSTKPKPSAFDSTILELAKQNNLEPALIKAVMHVESAFNPRAISSAGARGLMQLMPATAKRFGVSDSFHAIDNMNGGVKYLRWLFERFDGNLRNVLAGYNAGEGAVDQYNGVPPYRETVDYVARVLSLHRLYKADFSGGLGSTSNASAVTSKARLGTMLLTK